VRCAAALAIGLAIAGSAGGRGATTLSPPVGLPFAPGTKAQLLAGPHENLFHECLRGNKCNSLDFVPLSGHVAAAADGIVQPVPPACAPGLVVIAHAAHWATGYYHLIRIRVHPGDPVREGQWIGDIARRVQDAIPCRGSWDTPHVHFFVKHTDPGEALGDPFRNTRPDVDLEGIVLRGWKITKTTPTQGCMTYLKMRVCSPSGIVTNFTAHGGEGVLDPNAGSAGLVRLGSSRARDVRAFAGRPDYDATGTFDAQLFGDYHALAYDCTRRGSRSRIVLGNGRVHCSTAYFFGKRGTLAAVWTGSPLFSSPEGTVPGTSQREADRLEHRHAMPGCLPGISLKGRVGTLRLDNARGKLTGDRIVGGVVPDLAMESNRDHVGLLFC
jgi:Peptidase family M23